MEYVLALLAGLVWGGLLALLSCAVSLRMLRKGDGKLAAMTNLVRLVIDAVALVVPFLLKNVLPFRIEMVLVGTAAALGLVLVVFAFKLASGKIK